MNLSINTGLKISILALSVVVIGCDRGPQAPDFDQTLTQAQGYLSIGQLQSALIESRNLLRMQPESTEAHILFGHTLQRVGDYKGAAKSFGKALSIDKDLLETRYEYIDALIRTGQLKQSKAEIEIAQNLLDASKSQITRLKADVQLAEGNYSKAIELYDSVLDIEPQDSSSLLGLAIANNALDNSEKTLDWLNQAIESKLDYTEALLFQGYFYLGQKQPDRAEAAFSNALAALGKYDVMTNLKYRTIQGLSKAFLDQGRSEEALRLNKTLADSPQGKVQQGLKTALQAYDKGDRSRAEEGFEQVLQLAPTNQMSNLGLGMLKLQEGDIETAEHLLSRASTKLDDMSEKSFRVLTLARLKLGKNKEALDILTSGLKRFPESVDLRILQATLLAQNNRFDAGQKIMDAVIKTAPSNPDALNLLAFFEMNKNNMEKAQQLYLQSIKIRPDFFPAYQGLIASYKDQPMAAQNQIQALLSTQKEPVIATQLALSITHMMTQDLTGARDLAKTILKIKPDQQQAKRVLSTALYSLAVNEYQKQQFQAAYVQLKASIDAAPSQKAVTLLTRLAVELQRPDEAKLLLVSLIKQQPKFALGHELLGDLAMANSETKSAIDHFQSAWAIDPNFRLSIKLFKLLQENQDFAQASQHITVWYEQAKKAHAQKNQSEQQKQASENTLESSLFALTTVYERNQQNTKAIKLYEQLLKIKPDSPLYLNNIAWLKFTENNSDAVTYAEKAYELAPDTGEIIDTYAWILVQNGDTKKGVRLLQQAGSKSPNNPLIKKHLQEAEAMMSNSI